MQLLCNTGWKEQPAFHLQGYSTPRWGTGRRAENRAQATGLQKCSSALCAIFDMCMEQKALCFSTVHPCHTSPTPNPATVQAMLIYLMHLLALPSPPKDSQQKHELPTQG